MHWPSLEAEFVTFFIHCVLISYYYISSWTINRTGRRLYTLSKGAIVSCQAQKQNNVKHEWLNSALFCSTSNLSFHSPDGSTSLQFHELALIVTACDSVQGLLNIVNNCEVALFCILNYTSIIAVGTIKHRRASSFQLQTVWLLSLNFKIRNIILFLIQNNSMMVMHS